MYLLTGTHSLGPKEIDGLLVVPGKASNLLPDHLISGKLLPGKVVQAKPSIHISLIGLVGRTCDPTTLHTCSQHIRNSNKCLIELYSEYFFSLNAIQL